MPKLVQRTWGMANILPIVMCCGVILEGPDLPVTSFGFVLMIWIIVWEAPLENMMCLLEPFWGP
jgi:hypothetical protein